MGLAFVDAAISDVGLLNPLTFQWTHVSGPPTEPFASVFSFGAAGDHDATENTAAVLEALRNSDAAFFLSLGDLSFTKKKPESTYLH